jgi:hypothetical protein
MGEGFAGDLEALRFLYFVSEMWAVGDPLVGQGVGQGASVE